MQTQQTIFEGSSLTEIKLAKASSEAPNITPITDTQAAEFLLQAIPPKGFLQAPEGTAMFFTGPSERISFAELQRNQFYTPQDIAELKQRSADILNGRRKFDQAEINADNVKEVSTEALTEFVVKKFGKVRIGSFFQDNGTKFPGAVNEAWERPSELFAERSSGVVFAMIGHAPQEYKGNGQGKGVIWEEQEKPALLQNKQVTMIVEIDVKQLPTPTRIVFPNGLTDEIKQAYTPMFDNINYKEPFVLDFGLDNFVKGRNYSVDGKRLYTLHSCLVRSLTHSSELTVSAKAPLTTMKRKRANSVGKTKKSQII